tara:strand:- start:6915 stop:7238 length:324 start_codon:yes stop_codon:yes gene_type:complete
MDELTKEQKEALERFKSTKDDPETLAGLFYKILEQADPLFKDAMERKAAVLMNAGYAIGKEMAAAEDDPEKKKEMEFRLRKTASNIHSKVRSQHEKSNKEKAEKENN